MVLVPRAHFQESLSFDCYNSISRTITNLFHWICALVFRALLGFFSIRLLRQSFTHFQDSFSLDCCIGIAYLKISFHLIFTSVLFSLSGFSSRQCIAHLQDSLLFVCYVSIKRTFSLLFNWSVSYYFPHVLDSYLLDCCVSISRTFRTLFHSIVMFVSPTLLGIPFNLQLRQYLSGAFLGSLLSDGYLCILPTFRILFHWIVTLASHTFRIPFYSILRQYFAHFQDFLKSDRYGGTLRTLRILFP